MTLRLKKFGFGLALLAILGLAACQKEDLVITENYSPEDSVAVDLYGDQKGGLKDSCSRCFEVVYPVTLVYADSTTKEVNSLTEYRAALQAWFEANPGRQNRGKRPRIQLPFSVKMQDGNVVTIATEDDLKTLLATCHSNGPRGHRDSVVCIRPVFPVTVLFPDSTSQVVNSAEELVKARAAWRAANPTVKGRPALAFPFQATLADGTVTTIDNEQELRDLAKGCRGSRPGRGRPIRGRG